MHQHNHSFHSQPEDFCNAFWGVGDTGPNALFAWMRGAAKTTDELRNFWNERRIIEEEYASKLAKLAKVPVGGDAAGELRNCLDTLRLETEKQADSHRELAQQLQDLEEPTIQFHIKQITHRRTEQSALEKRCKAKQTQEAYVAKAREKYEADCQKISTYTQQLGFAQGKDQERLQQKLERTKQTVQANEKDFTNFSRNLLDLLPEWETEWKKFCDSCQDLEEERMEFMKDIVWSYANLISTICVADDLACERIRTALDQFEPEKDVASFVKEYSTGNMITEPLEFIPEPGTPNVPRTHPANFTRASRRQATALQESPQPIETAQLSPTHVMALSQSSATSYGNPSQSQHSLVSNLNGSCESSPPSSSLYSEPPKAEPIPPPFETPQPTNLTRKSSLRQSAQPLPVPNGHQKGQHDQSPNVERLRTPPLADQNGSKILFYVKALYDYQATIEEEFDFQAGDVIAVTSTPEDGWWSGELLDEARRVEGRHIFPSNFVCLF